VLSLIARVSYIFTTDPLGDAVADTKTVPTVADLFRRAQAMRKENPQTAYRDIAKQIVKEFSAGEFRRHTT